MHSAIYTGQLRHRRFAPRVHEFSYRLFMMYVDLSELDAVFKRRWFWSTHRPALAWLRRKDYLGDPATTIDAAVRDRVQIETGTRPDGPIRMLTHLRYFGVGFNPVTFYYCFDRDDTHVTTIVAEITNTPWKERHAYVLSDLVAINAPAGDSVVVPSPALAGEGQDGGIWDLLENQRPLVNQRPLPNPPPLAQGMGPEERTRTSTLRFLFKKTFHVSPFMSMDFDYDWRFSAPTKRLTVHMQNMHDGKKAFDATLDLTQQPITRSSLAKTLLAFPCMTASVVVGIYWQALKLFLKRIPFHSHPMHAAQDSGRPIHLTPKDARP